MGEVFVMREGTLRLVQASASGGDASGARVWATASAAPSYLLGYVDSFSHTSGQQVATQSDRGLPTHHKRTQADPIQVTFQLRWTGFWPTAATAAGASTKMWHAEFKAADGVGSAFIQYHGLIETQMQFTENADGDTVQFTTVALGMNGPTASGYLS